MKKLKRSSKNKVIAGIFGGLGEYMDVDPTILRLIGLLLFLVTGLIPFILVYIVAILIVPKTEEEIKRNAQEQVWRKWWFWIIILLIILSLLPIIAILAFRGFDPVANVNIHTEGQESREQVEEVVKEDRAPKKREVIKYLEEEIITPNYEGEIFADYYDFGRDANKLY
ncbi:MAG: PspC domain-containing protein, partial [bacterium]